MGRRGPAAPSLAEKANMWGRWKNGYPMREVARAFGRDHGSIRGLLFATGRDRTKAVCPSHRVFDAG
jgi:hypothetical protein